MLNVDIDTGGTMTDGLITGAEASFSVKVETTPHDMTISFVGVLEAAAQRLGRASLRDFLDTVELIRWSSTITSNVLAQRSGPKLGLLVTAGHEADLYGTDGEAATVIGTLVRGEDIAGIAPDADEETVRRAVKSLLDEGIRRINISLAGAFADHARERQIVSMIDAQYPDHFLGSIPALAASEILLRPDDMTRTFCSLINAYVHPSLASTLYRAEDVVRTTHGWRGNVLVGHISGGVARIGKTRAFDTVESGPLFGTQACAWHARRRGHDRVLALDVGGTTSKVSAVEAGRVAALEHGSLFGIPLRMRLPLLRSVALGGGSVAGVENGTVGLGPESMGAAPGPACYGLGGTRATLTDAYLALGLISPTAFLDGRRVLDRERAGQAIERDVAAALGVDVVAAAGRIRDAALDVAATLARDTATEMGWDPSQVVLYAYGGNGPLVATGVAERLGVTTVVLFGLGHVLSAFGSAISDVVHVYESAVGGGDAGEVAERLRAEGERDLRGEGFDPAEATYTWEVDGTGGARQAAEGDVAPALAALGGEPVLVRLTARVALPTVELPVHPSGGAPAPTGQRSWPTYAWETLAGARLEGPILVDGGSFTWLVESGWSMSVDERGDAVLTKGGPS